MDTRECALCGQNNDSDRSVLCQACQESNLARTRRMGRFIEVYTEMRQAIAAIDALCREYPDAAPLVDQAGTALHAAYPGIEKVTRNLKEVDREVDRKITAAHERNWRA